MANAPNDRSYWVVPGMLLAGCSPGDATLAVARRKLGILLDAGIRVFINLQEPDERDWQNSLFAPYEPTVAELARHARMEVTCVRFPIPDMQVASRQTYRHILDLIDRAVALSQPVCVHCWGGRGRTGTVVGCYLVRHGLATPDTVFETIQRLRQYESKAHEPSPQTEAQREMVASWRRDE